VCCRIGGVIADLARRTGIDMVRCAAGTPPRQASSTPSGAFGETESWRRAARSNYPEPAFRPGSRLTALKGGVSNRSQIYDE
jgi:hypothetical protein